MDPNLERARAQLRAASDEASRVVEQQLQSIDEGIFEEEGGERTDDEPGPKVDRIAELSEKLQGLEEQAEGTTAGHVAEAREHVQAYLHEHPTGE